MRINGKTSSAPGAALAITRYGALTALALTIAGCTTPSSAHPSDAPAPAPPAAIAEDENSVADELRTLEASRLRALVDADTDTVRGLYAEDYRLIPPPGYDMDRDGFLDSLESGDLDFKTYELVTPIEVRVSGDIALVTYKSRIHIDAAGVGEFDHHSWQALVYELGEHGWQLVWEQTTAVGGFPPQ